jgi:hypothetical protein
VSTPQRQPSQASRPPRHNASPRIDFPATASPASTTQRQVIGHVDCSAGRVDRSGSTPRRVNRSIAIPPGESTRNHKSVGVSTVQAPLPNADPTEATRPRVDSSATTPLGESTAQAQIPVAEPPFQPQPDRIDHVATSIGRVDCSGGRADRSGSTPSVCRPFREVANRFGFGRPGVLRVGISRLGNFSRPCRAWGYFALSGSLRSAPL